MPSQHPQDPEQLQALMRDAMAHHQAGRFDEALGLYRQALSAAPEQPQILNLAGIAEFQRGAIDASIALLTRATSLAPDLADAFRNLGIAYRSAGRLEDALLAHDRVVALCPDSAEAHNDRGMVLRRAGKLGQASEAYRSALKLEPNYLEALVNMGNVYQARDDMVEACRYYRRAIEVDDTIPAAHRNLGNALQRLGDLEQAADAYRRAVELDPDYATAQADLGGVLAEMGDAQTGIAHLQRALALQPDAANTHSNLGMAMHHFGDTRAALDAYERSLELEPGNSHGLAYKSIALLDLGRMDDWRNLVDHDRLLYSSEVTAPPGYADLETFNQALSEYAANHPTLMGESDRRPGITGELLNEPDGPMVALSQIVRDHVNTYLTWLPKDSSHPFVLRKPENFKMIGWATVLKKGADTHIHPHAWLSGVYYSKALELDSDSDAGCIEFGQPDPKYPISHPPEVRVIRPRNGLILLFPSFFWHRILDFHSQQTRISYAFDIFPTG